MVQERAARGPQDLTLAPAGGTGGPPLGLTGAAATVGALLAPGLGLALVVSGAAWGAGPSEPLTVVVAALALLPTAAVLAILSRELPAAGTVAAWLAAMQSPLAGARAGWLLTAAYVAAAALGTSLCGVSTAVALA